MTAEYHCFQVPDQLGPVESTFYRIWRDKFKHVDTPTHTPFAACDTCAELKENILMATNATAIDTWKAALKTHREEVGADRGIYEDAK